MNKNTKTKIEKNDKPVTLPYSDKKGIIKYPLNKICQNGCERAYRIPQTDPVEYFCYVKGHVPEAEDKCSMYTDKLPPWEDNGKNRSKHNKKRKVQSKN